MINIDHIQEPIKNPELQYNYIQASDTINLAYLSYIPQHPKATLVFYHGSGANSRAGYTTLAEEISQKHNIAVFLCDIRGHGKSDGARGDTPSPEQVWDDVATMCYSIKQQHPHLPLFLSGHSAGSAIILNATSHNQNMPIEQLIMIAPFLGISSNTLSYQSVKKRTEKNHSTRRSYISKMKNLFFGIANILSSGRLFGHRKVILLSNDTVKIKKYDLIQYYTCNMARAINVFNAKQQLLNFNKKIHIIIAEQDEIIDTSKLTQYLQTIELKDKKISHIIIKNVDHLNILKTIGDYCGKYITTQL